MGTKRTPATRERVLKAAVARDRENPFAWYQLGVVYEANGDSARARLASAPGSDALMQLRRNPRNALAIALLSALYGVIYFGGKLLPDEYFFWQRALLSGTEVVVILSFLAYLSSFWPMVRMSRQAAGAARATAAAARAEG